MLSEKTGRILIWLGIILIFLSMALFLWKDWSFDFAKNIDSQKFSDFGSFIGGFIGTIWALVSVILFYVALREQREDIKINRTTLQTQVKGLEQQIKEFELQRIELELTRSVFTEQSKTQKLQQFESTFFNTLSMFHNLIESISYQMPLPKPKSLGDIPIFPQKPQVFQGRDCFEYFYMEFKQMYQYFLEKYITETLKLEYLQNSEYNLSAEVHLSIVRNAYQQYFYHQQSNLGHYFRTMYNLVRFVNDKNIENSKYYTNLIRAGLSSFEHLMLFYNASSMYGESKFRPLIIKYSMLDNMPRELLLDQVHITFYPEEAYK